MASKTKCLQCINKGVRRVFERSRVIVSGIDDQWDADLASFIDLHESNDGNKYLLVVIDIFSRFAWIEPIKNKRATEIIRAFRENSGIKGKKTKEITNRCCKRFYFQQI